jgi:hypothetical protein
MIERQNLFPEALSKRVVGGHVLYSPVVTVVAGKLVFVSGLLARNQAGEIVGKGDMGAQIRQVGENLKAALAAAGATLSSAPRPSPPTSTNSSSMSACGWNISPRCRPAPPSRCAASRIRIFWSRSRRLQLLKTSNSPRLRGHRIGNSYCMKIFIFSKSKVTA